MTDTTPTKAATPAKPEHTCIRIWRFSDAPEEYTRLSNHGGDEDWVMRAPAAARGDYWPYQIAQAIDGEERSYLDDFGHVDYHELDDGSVVIIFAHA